MVWGWQVDPVNCGQALNKYSIVGLLRQATENTFSRPEIISSGFRRAGLFPWNTDAPDISKLLPGSVFVSDTSSQTAGTSADISTATAVSSSTMVVSASSDPEVSSLDISPQTWDTSATYISSAADIFTAPLSPDVCVYSAPEPSLSTNSNSYMVMSVSSGLSSMESPVVSDILTLDEPAQEASLLDVSPSNPTSVDLSISTYNAEDSPGDVLNDAMMVTQSDEIDTAATSSTPNILKCPSCSKRIPESVFHIHTIYCEPVPSTTTIEDNDTAMVDESLSSVPQFTLSDRLTMLNKFEVLLLSSEQISEFNQLFKDRKLGVKEPLFQSWLSLKIASVPCEAEALQIVLSKHTSSGVPKRKARRQTKLPEGPARYDPSSGEWREILVEQEENKSKKSKKRKSPEVSDKNKKTKLAMNEKVCAKTSKKASSKKATNKNTLRL